jgi:excisionase family DNA binding protein
VERLLSKGEVADLLNVSVRSVDRLRDEGLLKEVPVRGSVRFAPEDVADFVNHQRRGEDRG